MADITLSKAVRSNLLSLQNTATLMGKTQERLSTGNKVNSALDNPTNFFTASALNSRASDLSQLMDSVGNAVQTIAAADKGIKAITKLVESAQSVARQALQSAATVPDPASAGTPAVPAVPEIPAVPAVLTASSAFAPTATTTGGSPAVAGELSGTYAAPSGADLDITINGETVTIADGADGDAAALAINNAGIDGVTASFDTGVLTITNADGELTIADATAIGIADDSDGADEVPAGPAAADVYTINGTNISVAAGTSLADTITALNQQTATTGVVASEGTGANAGRLVLTSNTSNIAITTAEGGFAGTETANFTPAVPDVPDVPEVPAGGGTIPNPKRNELIAQYNELLTQIDQLAKDSGFNGVNLIDGDSLEVIFNEDGQSKLNVEGKSLGRTGLELEELVDGAWNTNAGINSTLDDLKASIDTLRTEASKFGSNLQIVENRQNFTKDMINVLQTGAANLTLADTNEEAANLLALQTRQSLSSTSLSMASQADQSVLQLLR
jgi:flagellin